MWGTWWDTAESTTNRLQALEIDINNSSTWKHHWFLQISARQIRRATNRLLMYSRLTLPSVVALADQWRRQKNTEPVERKFKKLILGPETFTDFKNVSLGHSLSQ